MADFAHTRRWWPACLVDEIMPPGRERPEDWLSPDAAGVTTIRWDDEKASVAGTITPGEAVTFMWWEERGSVQITIMPDGSWNLEDPRDGGTVDMFTGEAVPLAPAARVDEANWFAEASDYETMSDSMDSFARNWAANDTVDPEGERLTVVMGFWHDGVAFAVSADGRALSEIGGDHG